MNFLSRWRFIRVSPYLFAAHSTSSEARFDFQIRHSSGFQMQSRQVRSDPFHSILIASDLRATRQLLLGFEAHPGAITFPPEGSVNALLSTGPSASRITFSVTTITDGNGRIGDRSTFPAFTLAWLYIEPSPCGGVRPAGDPVDSDPGAIFEDDPHPRSDAGRPLVP